MGREEDYSIATLLFWEFFESSFDILGDSLVGRGRDISGHEGGKEELTSTKPGWYSIDQ